MQALERLAFIGGGNMAEALIGGLRRGRGSATNIAVAEPREERRSILEHEFGVSTFASNAAAVNGADIVLLSVKPQHMRTVVNEIAPVLAPSTLLISIAAGIPLNALDRWLSRAAPTVRAMPNRPALQGQGATALFARPSLNATHRAAAAAIMGAVGTTVWVAKEADMDIVTALSGSGPAYFFVLMEALEAAAVTLGLAPEVSHALTLETAAGAALMAKQSPETLATLRDQVTSKGGTTEAAIAVLEAANLRAIVSRAVEAAAQRSEALALEFAKE